MRGWDADDDGAGDDSKINYLDPRITVAWCKAYDVPVEKLFSKTLLNKCTSVSLNFSFSY